MTRAGELNRRQRLFVEWAEAHGLVGIDRVACIRACEYKGSEAACQTQFGRLVDNPKVRAELERRGIELPPKRGLYSGGEDFDTELGDDEDFDGTDPLTFFRRIAGDSTINLDRRMKAMERVEQIEKRSAPDTDAEARFAAQRTEAQRAIAARLERRQTAEGLAAELNQIRCTVRDADLRAVLSKAVASLVSKRDGSPRQRAKRSSGGSAKEPKEPREAA